ncbi:uncharacterized protein [Arachis hypogaea]|uniref:uncharacterized protein isoform X2 n=1 Tax=Arachis hypogaea TaxID=3818 RepID=UPI000DECAE23|nr:uncharacterized protein LOC112747405 isoform X2 [Arachis hypogaea]
MRACQIECRKGEELCSVVDVAPPSCRRAVQSHRRRLEPRRRRPWREPLLSLVRSNPPAVLAEGEATHVGERTGGCVGAPSLPSRRRRRNVSPPRCSAAVEHAATSHDRHRNRDRFIVMLLPLGRMPGFLEALSPNVIAICNNVVAIRGVKVAVFVGLMLSLLPWIKRKGNCHDKFMQIWLIEVRSRSLKLWAIIDFIYEFTRKEKIV